MTIRPAARPDPDRARRPESGRDRRDRARRWRRATRPRRRPGPRRPGRSCGSRRSSLRQRTRAGAEPGGSTPAAAACSSNPAEMCSTMLRSHPASDRQVPGRWCPISRERRNREARRRHVVVWS